MITINIDFTFIQVKSDYPITITLDSETAAEVVEMTKQQTIEKPIASVNTKRDDEACEKTGKLNDLLLSAVDETLKQVFKEAGAQVIYDFLGNKCHLKREEIAEKPAVFSADLKKLMVSAASVIEKMILEKLYSKLELKFEEKEGYEFSDYVKELREKYNVKT